MTHFPDQTLRIIDANLDRTTEGLRVMEDVARFVLDSSLIAARLKEIRHQIHEAFPELIIQLLSARDSAGDVGRSFDTAKEPAGDLIGTVVANARRVEQSLRVLEELSRLPGSAVGGSVFEETRYSVYGIEKELVSKLSRRDKLARLSGLYVIIENNLDLDVAIERRAAAVQFTPEVTRRRDLQEIALVFRNICREKGIFFIISEFIDIALAVRADGMVLDSNSMPIIVARRLLNIDQIIGFTPRSFEEGISAVEAGADYLISPDRELGKLFASEGIIVVNPA